MSVYANARMKKQSFSLISKTLTSSITPYLTKQEEKTNLGLGWLIIFSLMHRDEQYLISKVRVGGLQIYSVYN